MRRHLMFGTVFSAALAVAASAQTPAEQAGAAKSDSAQTITVSGCLRSADAKATGTAGSATAAPSTPSSSNRAGGFILTDISPSGTEAAAGAAAPATPTGTAGAGSSSEKKGYRLTGSSSELSSLVGKRVEVTGSLSNSSAAGAMAGSPAAPGAAAGGSMSSSSSQNLPQFRVTSVKEATGGASCPSEK